MKGDLHCHTRLSDGSEGIEEVISRGKRAGMDFLAITDHDTVASMSRAKVLADRYGVQVIPGVEFSSRDPKTGRKVHVLCYLPEKPDRLEGLCVRLCESRKKAGRAMIQKLTRYFPVSVEDVLRFSKHSTAIYKQHIMHALMCYGYTTHIFGGLYHELFDPKTGVLLSKVEYPEVDEVIDLIHQAQGLAVLAHPYEYDSIDLMKRLVSEEKLDGIEVYHSRCPQEKEGFLK
ncbi:MAG: PHP domain-containing protein, partial [Clostridiales bacterium]|nr:PHP domain-containing protein [Clostridiales bacterium]